MLFRSVAGLAQLDVLVLRRRRAEVHVVLARAADGGVRADGAAGRRVVVAREDARRRRPQSGGRSRYRA